MKLHNFKAERVRANLTQEQLAKAVKVSRQTIHSIETGQYIPSTIIAMRIAKVLNVTLETIFTYDNTQRS